MTGKELLKQLQANGWHVERISGSHHILKKPGVPQTLSLPVHGNQEVPLGTANNILRKAGLR
jgi:predicted RNA binding protein YcfA (HicA-like mRNA interferase family)